MKLLTRLCVIGVLGIRSTDASSTRRQLSETTKNLIDSRLIFVYDDEGCRELEAMGDASRTSRSMPMHRALMLGELNRRVNEETTSRWSMYGAASTVHSEASKKSVPLQSVYLESLEMEIAKVPEGMTVDDLERLSEDLPCVKYVARDDVKYAEKPDVRSRPFVQQSYLRGHNSGPTDPLYRYQWGLRGDDQTYGIDVEHVWREWQGADDMVIAIIDSGCNLDHADMQGQFWTNPGEICGDGIDNDGNGFVDDCHGWDFVEENGSPQARGTSHGTAAAGIIAAKSNNGEGVSGICWNCRLMCLRFISNTEGTVANEVRAIDYAVKMGAKISNNSYGGYAHT